MISPLIILFLLSLPLLIAFSVSRVSGKKPATGKYASWGLGLAFIYFFIGHLVENRAMVDMLPLWVPLRLELVYITGILELAIGLALFIPKLRVAAAKLAIVVFVIFFPANIYAALHSIGPGGHQWGPVYLLIRAPLQVILIAWTYYLCLEKTEENS